MWQQHPKWLEVFCLDHSTIQLKQDICQTKWTLSNDTEHKEGSNITNLSLRKARLSAVRNAATMASGLRIKPNTTVQSMKI